MHSERFARSSGSLHWPGRYSRLIFRHIGLDNFVERHYNSQYSFPDSCWRCVTTSFSCPRRFGVPQAFDGMVIFQRVAIAAASWGAAGSNIQPLSRWIKGCDACRTYGVSLNRPIWLKREVSYHIYHSSKLAKVDILVEFIARIE